MRAYNGGLEAEPPAGVQGAEFPVGVRRRCLLKLNPFCILRVQRKPQICPITEKRESITLLLIVCHVLHHKMVTTDKSCKKQIPQNWKEERLPVFVIDKVIPISPQRWRFIADSTT